MRFRRIEKDMGGMANVGLDNQHIQGKEDDVSTSDSKTYIGSNGKKKVAMNKIKNTKIGDDIHYYINGKEGRGIVIKMGNEFLQVFSEDRQVNNIHINDTFFVKDILVNKQWDDMDDIERYDALMKIHAPSPRYISKTWSDMPEQIKTLLQKEGGNMAGGTGSTYEEGESKDSETQDHARTGFAQNTQYAKKGLCEIHKTENCPHCGNPQPERKRPKAKKQRWIDPETGKEDKSEHSYRYEREQATEKYKDTMKPEEHEGHPDYFDKEKNPFWNKRVATDPNKLATDGKPYGKGHYQTYHPDDPVSDHTRRKGHKDNYVRTGGESPQRAKRKNSQNVHTGEADFEAKHQAYKKRRDSYDKAKKVVTDAEQPKAKPLKETVAEIYQYKQPKSSHPIQDKLDREAAKKPATDKEQDEGLKDLGLEKSFYKQWLQKKKPRPSPRTAHGSFGTTQSDAGQAVQAGQREATSSAASTLGIDFGTATKARPSPRTAHGSFGTTQSDEGQEVQANQRAATTGAASALGVDFGTATKTRSGNLDSRPSTSGNPPKTISGDEKRRRERHEDTTKAELDAVLAGEYDTYKSEQFRKIYGGKKGKKKSELEAVLTGEYEVYKQTQPRPDPRPWKKEPEQKHEVDPDRAKKRREEVADHTLKADEMEHVQKVRDNIKIRGGQEATKVHRVKSDVEAGTYGNASGSPDVGVSTSTDLDVSESTGYEERPHISVEEADKLPRATFQTGNETNVRGGSGITEPHKSQERKEYQNNTQCTYGMRYGMKRWCQESMVS